MATTSDAAAPVALTTAGIMAALNAAAESTRLQLVQLGLSLRPAAGDAWTEAVKMRFGELLRQAKAREDAARDPVYVLKHEYVGVAVELSHEPVRIMWSTVLRLEPDGAMPAAVAADSMDAIKVKGSLTFTIDGYTILPAGAADQERYDAEYLPRIGVPSTEQLAGSYVPGMRLLTLWGTAVAGSLMCANYRLLVSPDGLTVDGVYGPAGMARSREERACLRDGMMQMRVRPDDAEALAAKAATPGSGSGAGAGAAAAGK